MDKVRVYLRPSSVIPGISGFEEFFYLLFWALIPYGGHIVRGMYKDIFVNGALAGRKSKDPKPPELSTSYISDRRPDIYPVKPSMPGQTTHEDRPFITPAAEQNDVTQDKPRPRSGCCPPTQPMPSVLIPHRTEKRGHGRDKTARQAKENIWSESNTDKTDKKNKKEDMEEDEKALMEAIKGMKLNLEGDDDDESDGSGCGRGTNSIYMMSEIAGLGDVKEALEEFAVFFLHFPHLTRQLKQRSSTGILLFGPQGTGKTLLVTSFARQYNLALYDIRASAVLSKYVGEAEKFVRALFKQVRRDAPAVLLLDECDGLLARPSHRSADGSGLQLLQNELKNQWSDLIYSRSEVLVVGATNKPHDIDMDGFGRRLSLKLHVDLPAAAACQQVLKSALSKMRHTLTDDEELETLGHLCAERHLSGYDIHCLVEGQLRKALRAITRATHFRALKWKDKPTLVPCGPNDEGAQEGSWRSVAAKSTITESENNKAQDAPELSYIPFTFANIHAAILAAQPTVDEAMRQKHLAFAAVHSPRPPDAEEE
ncbi:hypothetical protein SEUCBS140593_009734 [Sporothrix eucalyptigena]|uniref:AAA+ ATPase domain-containing protein n=1 Tax=Sporothrix eucalyptigena TaxID=1812306 RepID=A0ABP0D0X5_9PEZI